MERDLTTAVSDGFRSTFGAEPTGVWSAPGRVSVAGDHTDEHDGLSFAFAVAARTAVAVRPRDDDRVVIATDLTEERAETDLAALQGLEPVADWRSYPLGMIRAVAERALAFQADDTRAVTGPTGLDVFLSTDLPIGGGLSSSASICAAIGLALDDVWGLGLDRASLAALGREAEQRAVGARTGMADHMTVLLAEDLHDVFYDARGNDASIIGMPDVVGEGLATIVVETGEHHRNWSDEIAARRDAGFAAAEALGRQTLREVRADELEAARDDLDPVVYRRARYIVGEIARTLDITRVLRTEGPSHVGDLLLASQASLRDDFEVSTPRIDLTIDTVMGAGAVGARITGAGLGGSVFVLAPESRLDAIATGLDAAYREQGWEPPRVTRVVASAGAARDR